MKNKNFISNLFAIFSYRTQINILRKFKFLHKLYIVTAICKNLDAIPSTLIKQYKISIKYIADCHNIKWFACAKFTKNIIIYNLSKDKDKSIATLKNIFADSNIQYLKLYSMYFSLPAKTILSVGWLAGLTMYQLYQFRDIVRLTDDDLNEMIILKFCSSLDKKFGVKRADHLYKLAKKYRQFTLCLQLIDKFPDIVKKDLMAEKLTIYSRMKMVDHLIDEAKEYLTHKPVDLKVWAILVEALIKNNRFADASEQLENYMFQVKKDKKKDWQLYRWSALLNYNNNNLKAALSDVYQGLIIKPNEESLLEYKTKILSIMGYKNEALEAVKALYARKQTSLTFDLMMSQIHSNEADIHPTLILIVDLTDCPNLDEGLANYNKFYASSTKGYSIFTFKEIIFVIKSEPDYYLPGLHGHCRFISVENTFDDILQIAAFAELTGDWFTVVRWVDLESFYSNLPSMFAPGKREGVIKCDQQYFVRTEILRDFLPFFLQSGATRTIAALFQELQANFFYKVGCHRSDTQLPLVKKILFITPRGLDKFGGVEEFIQSISFVFKEHFPDVQIDIIALTLENSTIELGTYYVNSKSQHIKNVIYSINPDIIWSFTVNNMHCILDSIKYHRALTVIGLHYYRGVLLSEVNEEFFDIERSLKRDSFNNFFQVCDFVYCNSIYFQRLMLDKFSVALPVIYSLPHKYEGIFTDIAHRENVLMVNTVFSKGFGLFLDIARSLPNINFTALSNQSDHDTAVRFCEEYGVNNITILPYQSDMAKIYSKARVVLVPSYQFIETFSRVCVEAQMHGVPVIGSNAGNVPYILQDSGIILPENSKDWVNEIKRLYEDEEYYAEKSRTAFENATNRYNFSQQNNKIERMLTYCGKRILLGIGSGIGNMVLASPLIKKLSRHYNAPVDVMIAGVPKKSAMLFANSPMVNAVYFEDDFVKNRYYDIVFLARSYSSDMSYAYFNAGSIYRTRDLFDFIEYRSTQETELELKSLEHHLHIPFNSADLFDFTICGNPYPPKKIANRIGIHAGSKGGLYLKKQWPYFESFAEIMQSNGFEVASLGTPNEYVEGTVNLTSNDTWDLINNISTCEYFVGNDSGISHLAKALGIPGTVLFGPTYSNKMIPYGHSWTVIHTNMDCAPCLYDDQKMKKTCSCMHNIDVNKVIETVTQNIHKHGNDER